jgi:hypothetical protein
MPLSATKRALIALKDVLARTDSTDHQALRLAPDANRKLAFILDTPRESDVVYTLDDVIVMILDPKLSRDLRTYVLDIKETSEGTVWTLRESEDDANSNS